jgi:hypothetical protein
MRLGRAEAEWEAANAMRRREERFEGIGREARDGLRMVGWISWRGKGGIS